ncbi:MAG: carboxypeptidase-like regulatory domain-containing protein [Bacteroidetes bacterium]|nr:carboxypeptidase-like regulatory domain-containing protein [Bacteroidota bacterium]
MAQSTLSGNITDSSGNPVPYATVYIQELQMGTTANAMGYYELRLSDGAYTVFYQSLGYNQDFRQVRIAGKPVVRDVSLTVQYFQIPEVTVTSGREDPAYAIMRKAIARAPWYLNAVNHYKAEVYLKGTAIIDKMPRIMKMAMDRDAEIDLKVGEKYLYESHNEIDFTAPDKYIHRLIAIRSNIPSESDQISPMNYIQASFYAPHIAIAVSPLSPDAFSHYRFSYQGASLQGQYVINKIAVIPKRKSQQVFSGTLFIIEDLWCIHSLDLENENIIGKIRVKQLHTPVENDFWMPVSHSFDVDFSMVGVKARANYTSSVKYTDIITVAPEGLPAMTMPRVPVTPATQTPQAGTSKSADEIEKLMAKDELTNRDMVRLSKLIDREASAVSGRDTAKKELEIKQTTSYIIDKEANARSEDFWSGIRPIPLPSDELVSLRRADSIRTNTLREVRPAPGGEVSINLSAGKSTPFSRSARNFLFGKTWRADSNRISITYGGIAGFDNLSFNTVDGFNWGTDFRITRQWKSGRSFSVFPEAGYTFSRKAPYYVINTSFNYSKTNNDYFWLRVGDRSADYSNYTPASPFINAAWSLLLKDNLVRFYHSRYLATGLKTEISNGIYLELSGRAEQRSVLENNTQFSFFRRDSLYKPNIPGEGVSVYAHDHLSLGAELTIIPRQRYRISGGRKFPAGSDYPTFILSLSQGFNNAAGSYSPYTSMEFSASKRKDTGPFAEFYWKARAGLLISPDSVPFQDRFHFNTQASPVLFNNYSDAFYLPAWYSMATDRWFAEGHVKYTVPYLALKFLPGLSNTLMRENLHARLLVNGNAIRYFEAGYSVSEIFLLGEAGIFAGFNDFRFTSAGVRIILRFN